MRCKGICLRSRAVAGRTFPGKARPEKTSLPGCGYDGQKSRQRKAGKPAAGASLRLSGIPRPSGIRQRPGTVSPPPPFSSGQARPLAREQVKVVAQASGAIEQGLAQGKIVRAAFAAQLPFPGLGSLGGIALVPGLDFLIVGRAFALFFDGQGIKFSFFPQVELTVQMAAAVDLRARGPV